MNTASHVISTPRLLSYSLLVHQYMVSCDSASDLTPTCFSYMASYDAASMIYLGLYHAVHMCDDEGLAVTRESRPIGSVPWDWLAYFHQRRPGCPVHFHDPAGGVWSLHVGY